MPEILTLPTKEKYDEVCLCGHDRKWHYDGWRMCLDDDCECPQFAQNPNNAPDPGGRDSFE